MTIRVKNVREEKAKADGYRVLVDRIWPRGISKEDLAADLWLKEVAPSTELRKWFGHDPDKFDEFARRYRAELDDNDAVAELRKVVDDHSTVTLLEGAHDREHNQAVVLRDYLSDSR
ncbi:DUF488 domain-containing protein [Mobilicoccus massiliensis]|uniref:DUF488 domain-containing protein n=1 Tax=Mobilicoccus massiliensis TaxID=1522310 RepID=UPI000694CDB7|nr:DUF488 domain-containing protein [Mobilicoccus massiliensis]